MTLGELFVFLTNNAVILVFYFIAVPMTAFLAGMLDRNEGHQSPWIYLYSTLIYLTCIPGMFSIFLNCWLFIFQGQHIADANIYVQLLPIASMLATLWLIRLSVDFDELPGFHDIWGFFTILAGLLLLSWIVDRSGLLLLIDLPFQYVLSAFIALLWILAWGRDRITST